MVLAIELIGHSHLTHSFLLKGDLSAECFRCITMTQPGSDGSALDSVEGRAIDTARGQGSRKIHLISLSCSRSNSAFREQKKWPETSSFHFIWM